jgi:hypothetical protein
MAAFTCRTVIQIVTHGSIVASLGRHTLATVVDGVGRQQFRRTSVRCARTHILGDKHGRHFAVGTMIARLECVDRKPFAARTLLLIAHEFVAHGTHGDVEARLIEAVARGIGTRTRQHSSVECQFRGMSTTVLLGARSVQGPTAACSVGGV